MEENIKEDISMLKEYVLPKLGRTLKYAMKEVIDEVERKKCNYTETEDAIWKCSKCEHKILLEDGTPEEHKLNYCPSCGARIEKVKEINNEQTNEKSSI